MVRRLIGMDDVPLDGKQALVRVDFNVTGGAEGVIEGYEDYRIKAAVPTIEELARRRCKVLLLTHRGRPGEGDDGDSDLTPVRRRLEELLREEVRALKHLAGDDVRAVVSGMEQGNIALLPNVRLDEREVKKSRKLAEELSAVGEVYVNEAFSVSHRDHTSVALLPTLLPACAGRRTVHEYDVLTRLRQRPERPYVAVISGVKVETKVNLLEKLLNSVDKLCLGGIMANTFLAAQGRCPAGNFDSDDLAAAERLWAAAADKIVLPRDVVIGPPDGVGSSVKVVSVDDIPANAEGVWDVGPATAEHFLDVLRTAKTVTWNGPLGKFEVAAYAGGTRRLAEGMASLTAWRVAGGGDTVHALEQMRLTGRFDHVSVGGGAMVAFLGGEVMPGLEPLYAEN